MTATDVAFEVRGMPVSQGNAKGFVVGKGDNARAVVVTGASGGTPLHAWREAIATEARAAIADRPPLRGPVEVRLAFRFPRPGSHFLPANGRRALPELRADAPVFHDRKPDADKLERAALDALTAVVFRDDAQVAVLAATKRYADEAEGPGVAVSIRRLEVTR